ALNTILEGCSTVECMVGVKLHRAIGTKLVAHRSWFDGNYGIEVGNASDIAIVGGEIVDTGIAAVASGVGVYVHPATFGAGAQVNRLRAYGLQFTTTGLTSSPIYGVASLSAQPYQF